VDYKVQVIEGGNVKSFWRISSRICIDLRRKAKIMIT